MAAGSLVLAACSLPVDDPAPEPGLLPSTLAPPEPPPEPPLPPDPLADLPEDPPVPESEVRSALDVVAEWSAEDLRAQHAVDFADGPGFAPLDAWGLDTIQASALGLDADELDGLERDGFVVSDYHTFPTFHGGYERIYQEDLPVYVSADMVLEAVHRSFGAILKSVERWKLLPRLERLVDGLRQALAERPADDPTPANVRADLGRYLEVPARLLGLDPALDDASVDEVVDHAQEAEGTQSIPLFGAGRLIDASQFRVRGHYTDSPELGRYFRAMMWLGRIDLRLVEFDRDGVPVLHRAQVEAAALLHDLVAGDPALDADWRYVEGALEGMLGEADAMRVDGVPRLYAALGIRDAGGLATVTDAVLLEALLGGDLGTQRIASHLMKAGRNGTRPLARTFLLFPQRYTVDSHVLSNVTWDRTASTRMMPDPLDVAFAALGNDHAAALLADSLAAHDYAADLAATRVLLDAHEPSFWRRELYHGWLGALRALAPRGDAREALPQVARTEAWGRRVLATQLASWAELRHDTILYTKQSYTSAGECEYPDVYVDPYPAFFREIEAFAALGGKRLPDYAWYFEHLAQAAATLAEMAERQRDGLPLLDAHLEFVNRAVRSVSGCAGVFAEGWYAQLHYDRAQAVEYDPVVADVHTQPTDAVGTVVGRVLHVGVAAPRLMVVTVETCEGPRAYAGVVSSYREHVTSDFDRLTDERWAGGVVDEASAPAWSP